MSVLPKQEPLPAADAAREPVTVAPVNGGMDQAAVDPALRRPPQSVATPAAPLIDDASGRALDGTNDADDTYDGEIVTSTTDDTPRAAAPPRASPQAVREDTSLFDEEELRDFRARWDQVQTSFVDEPRHAVEQADALVGTVVKRIADQFSEERATLERQSGHGRNVSTEDLRQNFRRYRAFFDRLLGF